MALSDSLASYSKIMRTAKADSAKYDKYMEGGKVLTTLSKELQAIEKKTKPRRESAKQFEIGAKTLGISDEVTLSEKFGFKSIKDRDETFTSSKYNRKYTPEDIVSIGILKGGSLEAKTAVRTLQGTDKEPVDVPTLFGEAIEGSIVVKDADKKGQEDQQQKVAETSEKAKESKTVLSDDEVFDQIEASDKTVEIAKDYGEKGDDEVKIDKVDNQELLIRALRKKINLKDITLREFRKTPLPGMWESGGFRAHGYKKLFSSNIPFKKAKVMEIWNSIFEDDYGKWQNLDYKDKNRIYKELEKYGSK